MGNSAKCTISGTVESPSGKGIPGVKITHHSGATTDSDDQGVFSITLNGQPGDEAELEFTRPGYADKVLRLSGSGNRVGFGAPIGRTFDPDDYPKYAGFNLELVEDWKSADWPDGLSWDENHDSNDTVWEPSDGGFPENLVRYQPEGIHFQDDQLVLRIEEKPVPNSPSWSEGKNFTDRDYSDAIGDKPLMGGEIRTRECNYRYGRYEMRMKPPGRGDETGCATGFLATMFTYYTPRNLYWRDLDIEVEGNRRNSFMTNIFYANDASEWAEEYESPCRGSDDYHGQIPADYDPRDWHEYAIEWLPDKITWLLDGKPVRSYQSGDKEGVLVGALSSAIVFNFWVFGFGDLIGGDPSGNRYPIENRYEWFRFYRWDQDGDKDTYPEG